MNTFHIQNQKKSRDDSDPSHASEAPKTPLSIQLQIAYENAFSVVYVISLPPFAPLPLPPSPSPTPITRVVAVVEFCLTCAFLPGPSAAVALKTANSQRVFCISTM